MVFSSEAPAPSRFDSFRFLMILWLLCAVALGPLSQIPNLESITQASKESNKALKSIKITPQYLLKLLRLCFGTLTLHADGEWCLNIQ